MNSTNARKAAFADNVVDFQNATGWNEKVSLDMIQLIHKGMEIHHNARRKKK